MICLVAAVALWQHAQIPARQSRAAFSAALMHVREGWTKAQVRQLLGPPDSIAPLIPIPDQNRRDLWKYGRIARNGFASLGCVIFGDGLVESKNPWEEEIDSQGRAIGLPRYGPVDPKVIGDAELSGALITIADTASFRAGRGHAVSALPIRIVKVANFLISKGQAKALAILQEYARLNGQPDVRERDTWLFWVVMMAFESKAPGGVFPTPAIGQFDDSFWPKVPEIWPTFPVVLVGDLPIVMIEGFKLGGKSAAFASYFRRNSRDWVIRTKKLTPSSDPFGKLAKLFASSKWPIEEQADTWTIAKMLAIRDLIDAVRSGFKTKNYLPPYPSQTGLDLDRPPLSYLAELSSEFQAAGVHWDNRRELYVRRDGSLDASNLTPFYRRTWHRFSTNSLPGIKIIVDLIRDDPKRLNIDFNFDSFGAARGQVLSLKIIDLESNASLCEDIIDLATRTLQPNPNSSSAKPLGPIGSIFSGAKFPLGHHLRIILSANGKTVKSPILKP